MTSQESNKTKNSTMLVIAIFYVLIGIAELGYFVIEGLNTPLHVLVLGILSLVTGYTIFVMKKWALPLVLGLLLVGLTFGITTLSNSITLQTFGDAMMLHISLIVYMILLIVFSIYILAKRNDFN
jgi:hypothetical protein